ncbi:MAG: OmpA family protein [Betaproteobacteria bacterium]|nr:OmpA family protein [Betaproteobacteria bacterium]
MKRIYWMVSLLGLAALQAGCATRGYVDDKVTEVNQRIDGVDSNVKRLDAQLGLTDVSLKMHTDQIAKLEGDVATLSRTAQEALDRATAAGKLSEGKMLYEVVLSDDHFKFKPGSDKLSKETKAALDSFAARLRAENTGAYVEVQGHTDSRGEEPQNLKLGERRAMAVYHYLHTKGRLPLHRMNVISYGESRPVANNINEAGRKQNRRVVLVVLK